MRSTRVDVKRFSVITARAVPPELLWDNRSEVVKRDGSRRRSESVGTRSICSTERRGDDSPGEVLCGRSDVDGFSEDKADPSNRSIDQLRLQGRDRSSVAGFLASSDGRDKRDNPHSQHQESGR